jgi:AraC family transcriptional regulator of arabinose operon
MTARRKYLNYTTDLGVDLTRIAAASWTPFIIHDSGYRDPIENWNHQGVDSPFWRFYFNPTPGCHLQFDGQTLPLHPGTAVLIPADTVFDCCGPRPASHFWLHFTTSRPAVSIPAKPTSLSITPPLLALLTRLITTHQQPASSSRDHTLLHLSASLLHLVFADLQTPEQPALPQPLVEILALITRTPHSRLTNDFLAERAGLSLESFIRTFRQHVGQTPAAYVLSTRLRLASEALALTPKTIDQIAVEYGFPNRHYFTRMFARQTGCGPAEFRQRQRDRKGP